MYVKISFQLVSSVEKRVDEDRLERLIELKVAWWGYPKAVEL